jgi:hypothetical protein
MVSVSELEEEVGALRKQEQERDRLIADLASQRDRASRLRTTKVTYTVEEFIVF